MCNARTGRFPVNEARIDATSGKDNGRRAFITNARAYRAGENLKNLTLNVLYWPMDILSTYELIKLVASNARLQRSCDSANRNAMTVEGNRHVINIWWTSRFDNTYFAV